MNFVHEKRAVSINSVLQYPYNLSESCSWRLGRYHKDDFYHNACAWCYFFLFRSHGLFPDNYKYLKVQNNRSGLIQGTYLLADAENSTLRTQVCKTLSNDECELWGLCCAASKKCCHRQIQSRKNTTNATACGITWDGLSCWEEVNPGEKSYQSCPGYLQFSIPTQAYSDFDLMSQPVYTPQNIFNMSEDRIHAYF
ncbi:hypothetical protein MAR_007333 [Mya arenaria]|uniref:G-protein coupled receptors family 2 profile 1 domain-containing protein n=1 Tax=Mya arenaria TaxID=6604 RepID=A0ABY7DDM7_MYAAR|nr:hypothetical protein MAR_007333 [Mya arenaria]